MLLVIGFAEASIYAITDAFGKSAEWVGVWVSIQGVGAVVGGLTVSRVVRRIGEGWTVCVGMALMAVSFVAVAFAPTTATMVPGIVLMGFTLPLTFVASTTLVQKRTPKPIMGRVSTALDVLLGTPQAASLAVGALLVSLLDYRIIWSVMGAATLLGATYLAVRLTQGVDRIPRRAPQGIQHRCRSAVPDPGPGQPDARCPVGARWATAGRILRSSLPRPRMQGWSSPRSSPPWV